MNTIGYATIKWLTNDSGREVGVLDTGGGNCSDCNSALRAVAKMLNVKEGWCLRIGLFLWGEGIKMAFVFVENSAF